MSKTSDQRCCSIVRGYVSSQAANAWIVNIDCISTYKSNFLHQAQAQGCPVLAATRRNAAMTRRCLASTCGMVAPLNCQNPCLYP